MTLWYMWFRAGHFMPEPMREVLIWVLCLVFVACAVWLSAIDLREHRLPNRIVYPWAALTCCLLFVTAVLGDELEAFGRSLLAGSVWAGVLALTRLIRPPPVGAGDVKLVAVLGMHAGYAGWSVLCGAALLAGLFGGALSGGLLLARRVSREDRLPLGPFLLAGTACAIGLR